MSTFRHYLTTSSRYCAIQGGDAESIYCLANWSRLVELNAKHILTGKSEKLSDFEPAKGLSKFLWEKTSLAPSVVIRRYDNAEPEEGRHIYDFLSVLVGGYG